MVFGRLLYKQIVNLMDKFYSKLPGNVRKGFNTQQCLTALIKKWKKIVTKVNHLRYY